jgi:hypothetical protein
MERGFERMGYAGPENKIAPILGLAVQERGGYSAGAKIELPGHYALRSGHIQGEKPGSRIRPKAWAYQGWADQSPRAVTRDRSATSPAAANTKASTSHQADSATPVLQAAAIAPGNLRMMGPESRRKSCKGLPMPAFPSLPKSSSLLSTGSSPAQHQVGHEITPETSSKTWAARRKPKLRAFFAVECAA